MQKNVRFVEQPGSSSVDRLSVDSKTIKRIICRMRAVSHPGLEVTPESVDIISRETTYLLKNLIQESSKFAEMGFSKTLRADDVNRAVKIIGHDHLFGVGIPKKIIAPAPGDGHPVAVDTGENVTLHDAMTELISAKEMPYSTVIHSSWLNQSSSDSDSGASKDQSVPSNRSDDRAKVDLHQLLGRPMKFKQTETIHLGMRHPGPLSQEMQQYFFQVVDTCMAGPKEKRQMALLSIRHDPNFSFMYRQLSHWIMIKTQLYTSEQNLELLLVLMCMTKNLILNSNIKMECIKQVLHELLPSVLTCVVTRTVIYQPNSANHGVLRRFAAEVLKLICDRYSNDVNRIHARVTKVLEDGLHDPDLDLVSGYGCLIGMYTVNEGKIYDEKTTIRKQVFEKFGSTLPLMQRRAKSDPKKKSIMKEL